MAAGSRVAAAVAAAAAVAVRAHWRANSSAGLSSLSASSGVPTWLLHALLELLHLLLSGLAVVAVLYPAEAASLAGSWVNALRVGRGGRQARRDAAVFGISKAAVRAAVQQRAAPPPGATPPGTPARRTPSPGAAAGGRRAASPGPKLPPSPHTAGAGAASPDAPLPRSLTGSWFSPSAAPARASPAAAASAGAAAAASSVASAAAASAAASAASVASARPPPRAPGAGAGSRADQAAFAELQALRVSGLGEGPSGAVDGCGSGAWSSPSGACASSAALAGWELLLDRTVPSGNSHYRAWRRPLRDLPPPVPATGRGAPAGAGGGPSPGGAGSLPPSPGGAAPARPPALAPAPPGMSEFRAVTFTQGVSAGTMLRFQLDDRARCGWDDKVQEFCVLGGGAGTQVSYWRVRYPAPMAPRVYILERRAYVSNLLRGGDSADKAAYILIKACAPPPGTEAAVQAGTARAVSVGTYCMLIRVRPVQPTRPGAQVACELATFYYELSGIRPAIINMTVRSALWQYVLQCDRALTAYQAELPNKMLAAVPPPLPNASQPSTPRGGPAGGAPGGASGDGAGGAGEGSGSGTAWGAELRDGLAFAQAAPSGACFVRKRKARGWKRRILLILAASVVFRKKI